MAEVFVFLVVIFLIVRIGTRLHMSRCLKIIKQKKYSHLRTLIQEACEKKLKFEFQRGSKWGLMDSLWSSALIRRAPISVIAKVFVVLIWMIIYFPQKVIVVPVDKDSNIFPGDSVLQILCLAHELGHLETGTLVTRIIKKTDCRLSSFPFDCLFIEMMADKKGLEILARHNYDSSMINKLQEQANENLVWRCKDCINNFDNCPLKTKIMELKQATGLL